MGTICCIFGASITHGSGDFEQGGWVARLRKFLDQKILFDPKHYCLVYELGVSGDSDFAIVLDKLKYKNKRVLVVSTRGRVAKELLERAKFIDLRKLKNEISQ